MGSVGTGKLEGPGVAGWRRARELRGDLILRWSTLPVAPPHSSPLPDPILGPLPATGVEVGVGMK